MQIDKYGITAMLARRTGEDLDAEKIGSTALFVWSDLDEALLPIIGRSGVAVLYKRSLQITLGAYPCLIYAYDEAERAGKAHAGLDIALSQQTSEHALEALSALLIAFHELLTYLIGSSLSERLIQSVWDKPTNGDAERKSE